MVFRADNHTAVDDDLGLEVTRDFKFRDDGASWLTFRDKASGYSLDCRLEVQRGTISYIAKAGPRTELTDVGYLLDRRAVEPFIAQFVGIRRGRRLRIAPDEAAEAIREGVFALATSGERLKFVPNFTVAWKGESLRFDAHLRAVFDDQRQLRFERHPTGSQLGWHKITDCVTGKSQAIGGGSVPLRELGQILPSFNNARPAGAPSLSGSIIPELHAALSILRWNDPLPSPAIYRAAMTAACIPFVGLLVYAASQWLRLGDWLLARLIAADLFLAGAFLVLRFTTRDVQVWRRKPFAMGAVAAAYLFSAALLGVNPLIAPWLRAVALGAGVGWGMWETRERHGLEARSAAPGASGISASSGSARRG
jgi:hypothetical protein